MTRENSFSKKLQGKSDAELQHYIDDKENFQEEAVLAAVWELEKRGKNAESAQTVAEEIEEKQAKRQSDNRLAGFPTATVRPGIRFVHFIIDSFILQLFVYAINLFPYIELSLLITLCLYPFYYIFFEYHYQWTPGKIISKTIVVNADGERPDLKSIILRTFARYIPFESLSCLGSNSWGWHDRLSKTYVILESDLDTLRKERQLPPITLVPLKLGRTSYIIFVVTALVMVTGAILEYQAFQELSPHGQEALEQMEQQLNDLDKRDYQLLQGRWITQDDELHELFFASHQRTVLTRPDGSTHSLNFKIESRSLIIWGEEIKREFIITESSTNKFKLLDVQNLPKPIAWVRK